MSGWAGGGGGDGSDVPVTPGAPLGLSRCTGRMGYGELSGTNGIVMRVVKDKHN